ncbi:unnamed protein product [Linum tenue]|uniref:Phosphatidic acid phosphatase type 2/haloperoxidase domain-containing protein n=1 Tax=Linum tenue TaxID=586396 RepID=A0AAV0KFP8_9ROSI|nr:unnamed protein product [Linum tenue]
MATKAALLHKPTSKISIPRPYQTNPFKPSSHIRVYTRKLAGFRGTATRGITGLSSNTMPAESLKSPGTSMRSNDYRMGARDREAFVKESPYGLEAALNSVSKWLVSAAFGAFFVWRHHNADVLWVATGAVVSCVLSVALKRILKQERPLATTRSDPGMPSSHAQYIFYVLTFGVLATVEWLGVNAVSVILSALLLACASYFSWLRVSQKLHTGSQVVVGAAVGTGFSALWCWLWNQFVLRAFISSAWVRVVVVLGTLTFWGCVMYSSGLLKINSPWI